MPGRRWLKLSVIRGLDPRIHHLRKSLSKWMDYRSRPAITNSRRRLFARLVDRDVLAVRDRGTAVGDDKRIEFDEAMALLLVVAGHLCTRDQLVAAARRRQQLHLAADVNPRPEDGVVDQHLVHDPLE